MMRQCDIALHSKRARKFSSIPTNPDAHAVLFHVFRKREYIVSAIGMNLSQFSSAGLRWLQTADMQHLKNLAHIV